MWGETLIRRDFVPTTVGDVRAIGLDFHCVARINNLCGEHVDCAYQAVYVYEWGGDCCKATINRDCIRINL